MASRPTWRRRRSIWLRLLLALAMTAAAWAAVGTHRALRSPRPVDAIEWAVVRRIDMDTKILVGGDLQPVKETTITCQVEDITDSDGTVIVSMVDNGTTREERRRHFAGSIPRSWRNWPRQEESRSSRCRSTCLQAHLALEVARITVAMSIRRGWYPS